MPYTLKLTVNYIDAITGETWRLPAVYTENGFVVSHLRYLAFNENRSEIWKERSVFSLRLLLDYINAMPRITNSTKMLKAFSKALFIGTIDYPAMTDDLGLFWISRSIYDANNILNHITLYTDFLSKQRGFDEPQINPFREASSYEERLNWCAFQHKKRNVFLNHLMGKPSQAKRLNYIRLVKSHLNLTVDANEVPRFPDAHFPALISQGFVTRTGEPDYKSMAITILLNCGGLRKSEVFHLYVSDITLDPNRTDEALVRVYHPEHGSSPDPAFKDRASYLKANSDYIPRNLYKVSSRLHSGWKGALLTSASNYFDVVFNPPSMAKEFLKIWAQYLTHQRIEPKEDKFHPFAFTNSKGDPETVKQFQVLHKRAVERIGLTPKKSLGTSEHGHRHAYGYRCRKSGLTQVEIQKAMHHRAPDSCLVYIKPTTDDLRAALRIIESKEHCSD